MHIYMCVCVCVCVCVCIYIYEPARLGYFVHQRCVPYVRYTLGTRYVRYTLC